jgi:hypothetical protein
MLECSCTHTRLLLLLVFGCDKVLKYTFLFVRLSPLDSMLMSMRKLVGGLVCVCVGEGGGGGQAKHAESIDVGTV